MIGVQTPIHARQLFVRLQAPAAGTPPGGPVYAPDGDGSYLPDDLVDLNPAYLFASIEPVATGDVDRLVVGTVLTTLSRIVKLPFHPDVTLDTVLTWTDDAGRPHQADILDVTNPDGRCVELQLVVSEIQAQ